LKVRNFSDSCLRHSAPPKCRYCRPNPAILLTASYHHKQILCAAFGGLLFSLTRTKPMVLAVGGRDQERGQK
jgi:hypothetical protein